MFARIGRLLRGFLGLFISGIEEANPEALMEAARQEFRQKMTQYNLALAKMAGVAERLKVQVKGKAARAQDLERRILANHSAGNIELAGSLARELQELKADLTVDYAGAEGDRRGLSGQPAPGEGRAAGVRGQDPPAREAAVAGQDQGSAGGSGHGALERRVQGRRPRRHDEDRRGRAAEALRSVGRQGARGERHGRHGRRPGEGERAQGARAGGAGRVPRQPGHAGDADAGAATPASRKWGRRK